jgi:hypothetical protein
MYPRKNHNYILPLEKSLPEALSVYGRRLALTIAVYVICLTTFFLLININSIFQVIGHFLSFFFDFSLYLIYPLLIFSATYLLLRMSVRRMRESLRHKADSKESKQTEDSDKLTRK